MFVIELIAYVFIGTIAGLLAGLLGISGGVVTVPLLFLVFSLLDFPKSYVMHLAIGTSLAAMVFNTLSATWMHNKNKVVLWKVVKRMSWGLIFGSALGALTAQELSSVFLELSFGLFACCLGLYMLRGIKPHEGDHPLPSPLLLNCIGLGVSFLSNILGIGGGIITVPTLMAFKIHEKKAIGTSSATSVIVTFLGALSYMLVGLHHHAAINNESIGYLYLPAFIAISITTFFAAPFGAKLTHILPSKTLRRIFAAALFATGLFMIFQ
ncbi:MAG: sulfite exporter TauE/SafE family protein [Chlamydiota bacterium]